MNTSSAFQVRLCEKAIRPLLVVMAVFLACFGLSVRAQYYTVTDLGVPATKSGTASEAHGINRSGAVSGVWWYGYNADAFVYTNGTNINLGALNAGHDYAYGLAMNDSNTIVGYSDTDNNFKIQHAIVITNGFMVDLGSLGDGSWSSANAINNSGLMVGETITSSSNIQAAVFQPGTITPLNAPANSDYSTALGVNGNGVIVGNVELVIVPGLITNEFGFIYTNGNMTTLGTLGSGTYSSAVGVNNSGQVVGESTTLFGDTHAYLQTGNVMNDLGLLGGGSYSTATAINNGGLAAGFGTDANGVNHAFISSGSGMMILDNLLPPNCPFTNLALAYGINDAGQICGGGLTTNGSYHAFLATPPAISLSCSTNITVTALTTLGAIVNFNLSASGGCSPATVTAVPPSGTLFPIGTTTVNVTASDLCGHTNDCSFTVTVNPPPSLPIVLTCPSNITVTAASTNGAVVTFVTVAVGGCSLLNISVNPPSGSVFPIGTTIVTNTASDSCGNSTNSTFAVTVKPPVLPITLSTPSFSAGGQFSLTLQGLIGQSFVVQGSTDLVNWVPLYTNILPGSSTNWVDPASVSNSSRYYRTLTLPQ